MVNRKIILLTIIALIGVVTISVISIVNQNNQKGVEVTFYTLPDTLTISINDRDLKSGKTIRLEPGAYSYTASHSDFETASDTITVSDNDSQGVFISADAINEKGESWYRENSKKIAEFERLSGSYATIAGENRKKRYPLTAELPLSTPLYSIGSKTNEKDNIPIITIRASEQYRQTAIQYLAEKGYSLGDYYFEFYDERNPFE